jgi:hypothetical protein
MASNNNAVACEVNTAVAKINDHLAGALTGSDTAADAGGSSTTIITLAGENNGATMEVAAGNDEGEDLVVVGKESEDDDLQEEGEEERVVSTYANSNYQAVNNSVLVSGSCAVNDPGVHVIVVEHVDEIRDYDDQDIDAAQEF